MSIQDWTVDIHRIEEGAKGDFHMTTSRVRLQSVGSPNVFKGEGQCNELLCIQTPSKSASPRSATPRIGFVITHSTVELPCKSAHRPYGRKQCEEEEGVEDEEEEDYCKCHSDFDHYDAYVQKYEADEDCNDNDWFCDCEDAQSAGSPLSKNLDAEDQFDYSAQEDWDFWADPDIDVYSDGDCWEENDKDDDYYYDQDYEHWNCDDFEEIDLLDVDEDEE